MNHERRVALARRITDHLLKRHPDIVAVTVEGSTAHSEDREHSDLEMSVITKGAPDTDFYQLMYEGIVIEIAFNSEEDVRRSATSIDYDWPFSADGLVGCMPMHDESGLIPELVALVSKPKDRDIEVGMRRAMTNMLEDISKMRNHAESGEEGMVRFVTPYLAYNAARFLSLLNRKHFNGTRDLLTKPRDFEKLPGGFWDDYVNILTVAGETDAVLQAAERLYNGCLELWRSEGQDFLEADSFEELLELSRFARR